VGAVTYFVRMVPKPGQAEAVQELLLTNPRRIEQGERGNLAFGVHRSTDNPSEFWLYQTWVDEAAVQAHESGDAFKQYKETLRPPSRARERGLRQHRPDQGPRPWPAAHPGEGDPVRRAIGLLQPQLDSR
jgi:quinol monooxygenase YgiN